VPNPGAPPLGGDSEARDDHRIKRVVDAFLRTHPPIPGFDRDDLYQEGRLAWLLAEDTYRLDGGASRATYIGRCVTNHLRDLARRAAAQRRGGGRRTISLDVPVTEDGDPLIDLLADSSPTPPEEVESSNLASRLTALRERLGVRQRAVFDGLSREQPIAGLARDLGVSRDTLYEDLRRIRAVARDEGLEDDLR
jgi:RNA polymerase sigma factor (sigma-70 family)